MKPLWFCEVLAWVNLERKGFYVDADDQQEVEEKARFFERFYGCLGCIYRADHPLPEAHLVDQLVQLALF